MKLKVLYISLIIIQFIIIILLIHNIMYKDNIRLKDINYNNSYIKISHGGYGVAGSLVLWEYTVKHDKILYRYFEEDRESENNNIILKEENLVSNSKEEYLKLVKDMLNKYKFFKWNNCSEKYIEPDAYSTTIQFFYNGKKHSVNVGCGGYRKADTIEENVYSLYNSNK